MIVEMACLTVLKLQAPLSRSQSSWLDVVLQTARGSLFYLTGSVMSHSFLMLFGRLVEALEGARLISVPGFRQTMNCV